MAERFAVGIDLGTSTSEVAVYQRGGVHVVPDWKTKSPIIPSVIGVDKHGVMQVGQDALSQLRQLRGTQEIKRLMGTDARIELDGKEYAPEELSAVLLTYLKRNAEEFIGEKVTDVVISVPANFSEPRRRATTRAAELAGLNVVRIVNEPTAAALAFGYMNTGVEGQIAVFDFGGGTLDVSVLEMMEGVLEVKATYGDVELGGKDFDDALIGLIEGKLYAEYPGAEIGAKSSRGLKLLVQTVKMALSSSTSADVNMPFFAQHAGQPVDLDVTIERDEFEKAIEPLLNRARVCVQTALAAKGFRPEHIDQVLLVGGTTYIPAVRRLVSEAFGREPETGVSPDLAVAMGTALRAAAANDMLGEDAPVLADVCSFGLGTDILLPGQAEPSYDPLIAPNTPVPFSASRSYSLVDTEQSSLNLMLIQSHDGLARYIKDAVIVRTERIANIPASRSGQPHTVNVEFSYDVDGLSRLRAIIVETGQQAEIRHALVGDESTGAMGSRVTVGGAVANMGGPSGMKPVQDAGGEPWRSHPHAAQYEPILERSSAYSADPQVANLIGQLQHALSVRDDAHVDQIADALTDRVFDLST